MFLNQRILTAHFWMMSFERLMQERSVNRDGEGAAVKCISKIKVSLVCASSSSCIAEHGHNVLLYITSTSDLYLSRGVSRPVNSPHYWEMKNTCMLNKLNTGCNLIVSNICEGRLTGVEECAAFSWISSV